METREKLAKEIRSHTVNILLWSLVAAIWIFLGIMKIVSEDSWLLIAMNFLVGALSVVDVIINAVHLIQKKKRLKAQSDAADTQDEI
ncbi:MAG: hypothetical protein IJW46_01755 [Clostridia bacterium]|nr:hypothetical protein [Clostridia bacterium]